MGPIDYQTQVLNPFQAVLQGYQLGAGIRDDQQQQQQQQAAIEQQQQARQTLQALMTNPNASASDFGNAMLVVPGLKDQLSKAWELRSTAQQQAELQHVGQVYSALSSGSASLAEQLLRDRASAAEAGGDPEAAKHAAVIADLVKINPALAQGLVGQALATMPGGDKVVASVGALQKQPAELRAANANATTAEVTAGNAGTAAELSNQKTAQEIRASQLQGQISQLNTQIAQANSETERGKLQLERDKLQQQLNQTQMQQGQAAQDQMDAINNALGTVQAIKGHPGASGEVGESWWTAPGTSLLGPMFSHIPGTNRHDLEAQVATLKSQQFLANVAQMKGAGALSDAEGARLEQAVASLDTNQSLPQFRNQLGVIEQTLRRAQAKLVARGQLPQRGEAFVMKHPLYGDVTEGTINSLMRQHPGATRGSVLQFLRSTGG